MPPNETLISDRPVRFLAIDSFGTQAQPYFLTYLADMGATLRSCLPRSGTFPTHRPFYWVPPNMEARKWASSGVLILRRSARAL
jgi:hypothetical protein